MYYNWIVVRGIVLLLNESLKNEFCKLLVIDKKEYVEKISKCLKEIKCHIIWADNEKEALRLSKSYDFALVMVNLEIKEFDAFELAKRIRDINPTKQTPFIFISKIENAKKSIEKGYQMGATDFIFLPVDPAILKSKVKVFTKLNKQKHIIDVQNKAIEKHLKKMNLLLNANSQLATLSKKDGLTNISNKSYLQKYLLDVWKIALNENLKISLIFCDIDYFKEYNEYYGHMAGDKALSKVAETINNSLYRPQDLAARFGGEEFLIVLFDTGIKDALYVAKRIKRKVKELKIEHKNSKIKDILTMSFGIASEEITSDISPKTLIKRADQAMYKAKEQGRNQIKVFEKNIIDSQKVININKKLRKSDYFKNDK